MKIMDVLVFCVAKILAAVYPIEKAFFITIKYTIGKPIIDDANNTIKI